MRYGTVRWSAMIAAGVCSIAFATPAAAQGWQYPSFTPPRVIPRELSMDVAGAGDAGTVLVGQWREGVSAATELSFQLGFASPNYGGVDTHVLLGGGFGYQLTRSRPNNPLDAVLTAEVNGAFGRGPDLIRVPIGVSIGHRFPLKGNMAITPYVHPRLSFDFWSGTNGNDDNNVTVNFDIGGNLELTQELSLRASVLVSGGDTFPNDNAGFGIGLAWRPAALR